MKYNGLLAILLSLFCLASCDKFLTEAPTTSLSESSVYTSEANLEAGIIGVYSTMQTTNGAWQRNMVEFIQPASRLISYKGDRTKSEDWYQTITLSAFAHNARNKENYNFFYQSIYCCNKMIEAMEDSPVDQTFKNEIEAEAKLIRAINYFSLVRFYGDVPLIINTPKNVEETDAPRTLYIEVYKQILKDLEYAEQNMRTPERQAQISGMTGRPHKGAATAFKAAVYAQIACIIENKDYYFFDLSKRPEAAPDFSSIDINTAEDAWKLALNTAEDLIQSGMYELAPSFQDLFNWGPEFPETYLLKERVFVLQSANNSGASVWTATRSLPQWPEGTLNSTTKNSNWGRVRPSRYVLWKWASVHGGVKWTGRSDKLENLYKSCPDPRYDISYYHYRYVRLSDGKKNNIYPYTGNGMNNNNWWDPFFKKYRDAHFDVTNGYSDMYLMRYAEVILYAAEAAASLSSGPGDEYWNKAMTYMEMIHSRARKSVAEGKSEAAHPHMSSWNCQTREELVDAIIWERIFELHGENHEFFDTHRRGSKWMSEWLCKPMNEFLAQPEQNYANSKTPERTWKNMVFNGRDLETDYQKLRKGLLLAFPDNEFRNNAAIGEEHQNDFFYSSLED